MSGLWEASGETPSGAFKVGKFYFQYQELRDVRAQASCQEDEPTRKAETEENLIEGQETQDSGGGEGSGPAWGALGIVPQSSAHSLLGH